MRILNICNFLPITLLLVVVTCCCGPGEPEAIVEPWGESPTLFTHFPEQDYLLAVHLNADSLKETTAGREILGALVSALPESLTENLPGSLAIAVGWDSRSWPRVERAFPFIVALSFEAGPESIFEELDTVEGSEALRTLTFATEADSYTLFLAVKDGDLLLGNNREIINAALAKADSTIAPSVLALTEAADKRLPLWAAARHTASSRRLLQQFVAGFDSMVIDCDIKGNELHCRCVMTFEKKEAARQAVLGFDLLNAQLPQMQALVPEEQREQMQIITRLLSQFEGEQVDRQAYFHAVMNVADLFKTDDEVEVVEIDQ